MGRCKRLQADFQKPDGAMAQLDPERSHRRVLVSGRFSALCKAFHKAEERTFPDHFDCPLAELGPSVHQSRNKRATRLKHASNVVSRASWGAGRA